MKSMKLSDLTPLRAQLMLATCLPGDFMKINMLLLLIGTMICLCKELLMVILIYSLGLLRLFMTCELLLLSYLRVEGKIPLSSRFL